MFDIQTEAYLRSLDRKPDTDRAFPVIPVTMIATLALWTGVIIGAL